MNLSLSAACLVILSLAQLSHVRSAIGAAQAATYEQARAALAAAANTPSGGPAAAGAAAAGANTSASPCTASLAATFCAKKPSVDRFYANVNAGCTCFYRCTPGGAYAYDCKDSLLFSDTNQRCDWPNQVDCGFLPPSLPPKPPRPPPPKPRPPSPQSTSRHRPPPPKRRPALPRPLPPRPPRPPPSPRPPRPQPPKPPFPPHPPAPPGPRYRFVAYYESWADPWRSSAADHTLAKLPSYANIVCLSFMLPDATYSGGVTFQGTGLSFSSDPAVVKGAIALLKQRKPFTKVLISVGGATYPNWDKLNVSAISTFVRTFGLDGVDVDYEGEAGCYKQANGRVACGSDELYTRAILRLRAALPRPRFLITTAAWSIGAYGEGMWANSLPQGSNTGMSINVFREAGYYLDYVFVMSYDAGDLNSTGYNPVEAIKAYCHHFKRCNRVLAGVQVPPEAWGGAATSVAKTEALGRAVVKLGAGGLMMWATLKQGQPSAQALAKAACRSLAMGDCTQPLLPTSAG